MHDQNYMYINLSIIVSVSTIIEKTVNMSKKERGGHHSRYVIKSINSDSIGIDHVPGNKDLHILVFIDNIKIFLP